MEKLDKECGSYLKNLGELMGKRDLTNIQQWEYE